MPCQVYVKLDDCKYQFLPIKPCEAHAVCGTDANCPNCISIADSTAGVYAVKPIPRTWKYKGPEVAGDFMKVKRFQLPLGLARTLTLYSMQGMTADPGLIAHWDIPANLSSDIKWLIVYVMLSRARSLDQLRSMGMTTTIRKIIESGAPIDLVQTFDRLFAAKIKQTKELATEASKSLGWR